MNEGPCWVEVILGRNFVFFVIIFANPNFKVLSPSALDFFVTTQFAAFKKNGALGGTKVFRQEDISAMQPCPSIIYFSFFPYAGESNGDNSFSLDARRFLVPGRVTGCCVLCSGVLVFFSVLSGTPLFVGRIPYLLIQCPVFLSPFL